MHGGLSNILTSFQQIRNMSIPMGEPFAPGLLADLLWADPCKAVTGFSCRITQVYRFLKSASYISGFKKSPRGIGNLFGEDVVKEFCAQHDLDLIARAHQVKLLYQRNEI